MDFELVIVEKILKGSLDLIPSPSPSVKIKILGGKVCLRCKDKTSLGVANKLLKTKSLLKFEFSLKVKVMRLNHGYLSKCFLL